MKKKICFIIPTHWSAIMGGSQYQAKCIIEYLDKHGNFDIYFLTRRRDDRYRSASHKVFQIARVKGIRKYAFFFDTPNLLRLLYKIKPDYIYQRVGCAYTGIAAFYSNHTNCKMIWHVASDADVLPLKNGFTVRGVAKYIDKKFLEYGVKKAAAIVTQTYQQARNIEKYYDRNSTAVIYNFHSVPKKETGKKLPVKIIWIANFKKVKQPKLFIQLAKDLRAIDTNITCVMVGSPDASSPVWQGELQSEIDQLDNLHYIGGLANEKVNNLLDDAHILVNTSRFEGFSNTFIQAWMRSVPVVSLHSNPDEILDRYQVGFCSGTYETLLQDVVKLIHDPDLRDKMGENARNFAIKECSNTNIEKLLKVVTA